MYVLDDQVLETVKLLSYSGSSLMIENVKFCYKNSNKFIITQFDCTVLLYDIYQVSINICILNVYIHIYIYIYVIVFRKILKKLFSIEN